MSARPVQQAFSKHPATPAYSSSASPTSGEPKASATRESRWHSARRCQRSSCDAASAPAVSPERNAYTFHLDTRIRADPAVRDIEGAPFLSFSITGVADTATREPRACHAGSASISIGTSSLPSRFPSEQAIDRLG
jgi:hypothetical protein